RMGRRLRPGAHRAARAQGADRGTANDRTDGRFHGGGVGARAADELAAAQHDGGLSNADGTDFRAARAAALQSRRGNRRNDGLAAHSARVRRRAAIEVKAENRAVCLMLGRATTYSPRLSSAY